VDVKVFRDEDGDISVLDNKIVGFIGYGNQGRSQAMNLRDQGVKVIVGNRKDDYRVRAENDGFKTYDISEAVPKADMLFILVPDELQLDIFENQIRPFLKEGQSLVFAHGYNIAFDLIKPPKNVDVLLIAPRMIGIGVRETFLSGEGYFSFIGIHQNASGKARENLMALTKGVGGLTKGTIETSFQEETTLDLFTEQGFGGASGQIFMNPINILIEAGYPKEAVLVEFILSGAMKHAFYNMLNYGITTQVEFLNERTQYGALSRGLRYKEAINEILEIQGDILKKIENGQFAEEWEKKFTKIKFRVMKFFVSKVGIGKMERQVRKKLRMPEIDLWAETPYPTSEDIKKSEQLKKELEEFKYFKEF
jgi:ketol-acid reductoisomerase